MFRKLYSTEGWILYQIPIMPMCDQCDECGKELCPYTLVLDDNTLTGSCEKHRPDVIAKVKMVNEIDPEHLAIMMDEHRQVYNTRIRQFASRPQPPIKSGKDRANLTLADQAMFSPMDNNDSPADSLLSPEGYGSEESKPANHDIKIYLLSRKSEAKGKQYYSAQKIKLNPDNKACYKAPTKPYCVGCAEKKGEKCDYTIAMRKQLYGICKHCIKDFCMEEVKGRRVPKQILEQI